MTGADNAKDARRLTALLDEHAAVSASLKSLAAQRGYVERGDSQTWLEWYDGVTPPPTDPRLLEAFLRLRPFEPFGYPLLPSLSFAGQTANVPEPTFLSARPATPGRPSAFSLTSAHTRELAGQLDSDGDRRVAPSALGWLIAYRDALVLDLRRCAARLEASPYGSGTGRPPLGGALAVVKVWLAEAVLAPGAQGTNGTEFLGHVASTVWESFKSGERWGDIDWLTSSAWFVDRLGVQGLDRAVVASALRGLGHYARARDLVTDPAHDVWARLLAAETVLDAALRGTPMSEAWVEATVRRQAEEEARRDQEEATARAQDEARAQLGKTLLDHKTRLAYIMDTFHPQASADQKTGSVWEATHALYVEAWRSAGLPEGNHPYEDGRALSDAATAARRRARDKKAGRVGHE